MENLTLMEQKRTQKEKLLEKKILIHDLLILGRDRLVDEYNHRQLSKDKFGIYYNKKLILKNWKINIDLCTGMARTSQHWGGLANFWGVEIKC